MTTAFRVLRDDINPLFYRVLVAALLLLIGSTVLLRFAYHDPERPMNWVDALYFTASTVATVGYGDFSFIDQHTWLRLWGIGLIFVGLLTTAILVAFIADLLLSRRFVQSAGRRQVRHLRDHIVVVGLGSFGIRVVSDLKAAGHDVAVIERNEDNRYLSLAAELDVPVIFGDAKLRQTLEAARLDEARAVALLTQDDMVNIETGIVLREMLGPRVLPELNRPDVPIVLRVYDRALGAAVAQRFGFDYVRSTSNWPPRGSSGRQWDCRSSARFRWANARSWSAASASSATVHSTGCGWRTCPPRPGSRAGDTAYLVGPYRELAWDLRCARDSASPSSPASVAQRRQVEPGAGRVGDRRQPAVGSVLGGPTRPSRRSRRSARPSCRRPRHPGRRTSSTARLRVGLSRRPSHRATSCPSNAAVA